jgi:hypothetical protein
MEWLILTPAYGRRYRSDEEVLADWRRGKDFKILGGPYTSVRDFEKNTDDVRNRYNRCGVRQVGSGEFPHLDVLIWTRPSTDEAVRADLRGELAAVFLAELWKVYEDPRPHRYTGSRAQELEGSILATLRGQGYLENVERSHVELACLEHGVVHVHTRTDGDDEGMWLTIDPVTGAVS